MIVNLIVGFVTLLMAGFLSIWAFFPSLRRWMEEPKYRFLERQRLFPNVTRQAASADDGEPHRQRSNRNAANGDT